MRLTDIINPEAIAVRWRNAPDVLANDPSLIFFPKKFTDAIEIKWGKGGKGVLAPLQPSKFDAIPKLRFREGLKVITTKLPFFREAMDITEEDMAEIAKAQTDEFLSGTIDNVYDDADELKRAADLVPKIMRYQLLNAESGTPKVVMGTGAASSDNEIFAASYDPDGNYAEHHYLALSGTAEWSAPTTAAPLDDIETGLNYLASIGVDTSTVYLLMNTATLNLFKACNQVKDMVLQQSGAVVARISKKSVADLLSDEYNATLLIEDGVYMNYAGSPTKFYKDGYVTIICPGNEVLGHTVYGATAESYAMRNVPEGAMNSEIQLVDGVAVCQAVNAKPPFAVETWAAETVLPSYEGMENTFVIKVD